MQNQFSDLLSTDNPGNGCWPLTDRQLLSINRHQDNLIDLIELSNGGMFNGLASIGVITRRQMQYLVALATDDTGKVRSLLDLLTRRSQLHYNSFLELLRNTNQDHVASLLESGGKCF